MAQGRCSAVLAMVALVVVSAAAGAQGAAYTVGDDIGWTVPTTSTFYGQWAASKMFKAGDTLRFVYNTAAHDVLTVTSADYSTCTLTSTNMVKTGNDTVTLVAGVNSYVCGTPGHCQEGQKLTITAAAAPSPGSPLPITTPAPPTTSPDTTNNNTASGTTVTIFQVAAAAVVSSVALLTL